MSIDFRRWINLCETRVVDVSIGRGHSVEVYVNPSRGDIARIVKASTYGNFRGVLGNRLVVWSADETTHDHIDDSGELGRLTGIRFTGNMVSIELATYGRDGASWPENPETGDDFTNDAEIESFFENNPLVKTAFGGIPATVPNHRRRG